MVDGIDVHDLIKECALCRSKQSDSCDGTDSCLKELLIWCNCMGFTIFSGYCLLILKLPVVLPRCQKVGRLEKFSARLFRRMYPHFKNVAPSLTNGQYYWMHKLLLWINHPVLSGLRAGHKRKCRPNSAISATINTLFSPQLQHTPPVFLHVRRTVYHQHPPSGKTARPPPDYHRLATDRGAWGYRRIMSLNSRRLWALLYCKLLSPHRAFTLTCGPHVDT